MPVAFQQKSRLTQFEMRTEFARQRREDRHVASNAPFGVDDCESVADRRPKVDPQHGFAQIHDSAHF
jgi:hypothetical protein